MRSCRPREKLACHGNAFAVALNQNRGMALLCALFQLLLAVLGRRDLLLENLALRQQLAPALSRRPVNFVPV